MTMPESQQQQQSSAVTPADARTYLADFVPDPTTLTALADADVVAWHGKVNGRVQKDVEAAKPTAPVIPDKYDLKLPEKSLLDGRALESVAATAKALGLPQDAASKLVEHTEAAVSAYVEATANQWRAKTQQWQTDLKAHPTVGGEGFSANMDLAKRMVDKYGSTELKQALEETGYGNFPALVEFVVKIGKAAKEDQLVHAGTQNGRTGDPLTKFYDHPTSQPKT
jgi:hypothetical protein